MSLLEEHFAQVAEAKKQGLPIIPGVFMDVSGTLVRATLNRPLAEFALWNKQHKLLGYNRVFSSDQEHALELLAREQFDITTIGAAEVEYKAYPYNEAFNLQRQDNLALLERLSDEEKQKFVVRPSHRLELVIDDSGPYKEGIKKASLVLTCWDPNDAGVRSFLINKEYLNFKPA